MGGPSLNVGNHDELVLAYSRQLFVGALTQSHNNRTKAMKLLGMTRKKFYKYLKIHELDGKPNGDGSEGISQDPDEIL